MAGDQPSAGKGKARLIQIWNNVGRGRERADKGREKRLFLISSILWTLHTVIPRGKKRSGKELRTRPDRLSEELASGKGERTSSDPFIVRAGGSAELRKKKNNSALHAGD